MALVIPTGFGEAAIEIRAAGDPEPWYVTHGVGLENAGGDFVAAAVQCANAFADGWKSSLADFCTITGCDLRVGQDGGPPLVVRGNVNFQGEQTNGTLPQNCALLIHKPTDMGGRRGRGRCYVPAVLEESKVNGLGFIEPTEFATLVAAAEDWQFSLTQPSGRNSSGFVMDWYLLHNPSPNSPTPAPTPIGAIYPDQVIATQRTRMRR